MTLDNLIIHPSSSLQLQSLLKNQPHAVLLTGGAGVGLCTIAESISTHMNNAVAAIQVTAPDDKGTISIDSIRELYVQTRSKSKGMKIFLIDDADAMGGAAQNAFLKLLEEPNKNIVFILTSHQPGKILPTIHSRVQHIEILPVDRASSLNLVSDAGISDPILQSQLMFIGQGKPAELLRLASDEEYRKQKLQLAGKAKDLLSGDRYRQLALIASISNAPRAEIQQIIDLTIRMLRAQLAKRQDDTILERINSYLLASEKIAMNGHVRSQLIRTVK